jgi:catechol 2,3-dioxygenase-like lactoylglutathione lyase family enzyme
VADTETTLKFYRDLLGMRIVGSSENYGTKQEHLNNVFGARLLITSLRAAKAPGVELLEYLSPRDGRPIPADERADDIVHWQTEMVTDDANAAEQRLHRAGVPFVSSGTIAVDPKLGFRRGLLVRDPDGHVVELTER